MALYFHVFDDFPLVIAANRDERYDRPSMRPYAWRTSPAVVAGKDLAAGGTWLGVNEYGLAVAILNRRDNSTVSSPSPPVRVKREGQEKGADSFRSRVSSLASRIGPETREPGEESYFATNLRRETRDARLESNAEQSPRSRGLLCFDVLRLKTAAEGIEFVRSHRERYQPFTLVFADVKEAWAVNDARQEPTASRLNEELHVFSNTSDFNLQSEKTGRVRSRFVRIENSLRLNARAGFDWPRAFLPVLGDHTQGDGSGDPKDAICVHGDASGTVSSSIIVYSRSERQARTFFCPGPPCQGLFKPAIALNIR